MSPHDRPGGRFRVLNGHVPHVRLSVGTAFSANSVIRAETAPARPPPVAAQPGRQG